MSNYGFTSAGTSYDDEDRLTGFARASGTFTQSWSLTSVGDWNSITTNGTAQNRTHFLTHSRHPYTDCTCPDCSTSSSSLSPPASGLLPDFDNKLKSADVDNNGSNDVTFQYDALGRRVARQGTSGSFVYVQQDQQTIADYGYGDAPSLPTHRYVYASYIDEPVVRKAAGTSGTIHYYHRNQQFSITAVTTSSGSVAERYAYTAYGQPTILDGSGSVLSSSAINNRYTYTGREWDATLGLYHFRARWMSGIAGRFMGRDPIGYADGLSQYAVYMGMRKWDPSGAWVCNCDCTEWHYTSGSAFPFYNSRSYQTRFIVSAGNPSQQQAQAACSARCDVDFSNTNSFCGNGKHCEGSLATLTLDENRAFGICSRLNMSLSRCSNCTKDACERAVLDLTNAISQTWLLNILGLPLGPQTCSRWANDCYRRIPELENNPCIAFAGVNMQNVDAYGGLTSAHFFVKIIFCDGSTLYADNGALGGGDHIFFEEDLQRLM